MDVAYNQHSPHSRHNNRSSLNLNHLTLAPLTSRLPLSDHDAVPETGYHVSYIEGRSAPTTPSILSRSSSRVSLQRNSNTGLTKSKSSTQLLASRHRSGTTTPGGINLRRGGTREGLGHLTAKNRSDVDWLLRAGTAIASSTRESKGQAWLVSRASSTSLTGQRDQDEEELERELARDRELASRRGSAAGADADDEYSPLTARRSLSFEPATGTGSRPLSRFGSRVNSRRGSRVQLATPLAGEREGYFDQHYFSQEEFVAEPDFVDVEDEGFEDEREAKEDEDLVRKLARASNLGLGGWVGKMLGWSLFAVDEDGEETEADMSDGKAEDSELSSRASKRNLNDITNPPIEDRMPPLRDDDAGGWQDAAWLLSVATKVLL